MKTLRALSVYSVIYSSSSSSAFIDIYTRHVGTRPVPGLLTLKIDRPHGGPPSRAPVPAQQTHNVNTTLYNVVRRLFSQRCEKDVPATLPKHKMTTLQCNLPTTLQNNVVFTLYITR